MDGTDLREIFLNAKKPKWDSVARYVQRLVLEARILGKLKKALEDECCRYTDAICASYLKKAISQAIESDK